MGSAPARVWALHVKLPRSLPRLPKSGPSLPRLWMGTWRQFLPEGRSQVCTQCPQAWVQGLRVGPSCRVHTCQPAAIQHLLGALHHCTEPHLGHGVRTESWGLLLLEYPLFTPVPGCTSSARWADSRCPTEIHVDSNGRHPSEPSVRHRAGSSRPTLC